MVGTVLKGDLQSSIEDQLSRYAQGLGQAAGSAQQTIGDTWEDLQRAGRTSAQDVQAQLSDYATQAYNAAQEQQRQAAEQAQQQALAVQQHLTDYAAQVAGAQQQAPTTDVAGAPAGAPAGGLEAPTATLPQAGGGDWLNLARDQLNKPYIWGSGSGAGGRGTGDIDPNTGLPKGFDCSGYVSWVLKNGLGVELPAQTASAYGKTQSIDQSQAKPGDIVFYNMDNPDPHMQHMALYIGNGQIIQAGGTQRKVNIDSVTSVGRPEFRRAAGTDAAQQTNVVGAALQGAKGAVQEVAQGGIQGVQGALQGAIDNSSPAAFARSFAPYAQYAAEKLGIDPTWVTAMAASESNYGKAPGNELFGVKGTGNAGSQQLATHEGEWGGTQTTGGFAAYQSPKDAVDAWIDLLGKRYQGAIGAPDLPSFVHGLKQGGYFTAAEPEYLGIVQGIANRVGGEVAGALSGGRAAVEQGVAGARRTASDVIQAGQQIAGAKPVIYNSPLAGASPMDQLQTIQSQLDQLREQLAGAPEGTRRAVTQAAEPIVAGAQEALGTLGGAFTRPLGETFPQLAGAPPEDQAARQQAVEAAGQEITRRAAEPLTPGGVAGDVWNAIAGATPAQGITWEQYQQSMASKNKWIEEHNPAKDVPLVGGLTSGIAQQLTDPLQVLAFGPTMGAGRAIGESVGETIAQRAGQTLSPQATRFVSTVAEKLTGGALSNGVQNAVFEAERPDASPESVGQAFVTGAALGGVLDVGSASVAPLIRNIGRQIIDRAPEIQQALRTRQRGEVDLGLITTGEPTPREGAIPPRPPDRIVEPLMIGGTTREPSPPPERAVAGVQRLPTYLPAGAPEAGFEAIARASREAQPDGRARLDLNTVPKDILPFTTDPAEAAQEGMVKLNPGGMPHTDDLRALWEANQHKRSFYTDQGDEAANIVGPHNTGEFFTLNSINSILTRVNSQVAESIQAAGLVRKVAREGRAAGLDDATIRQRILDALADPKQNPITGKAVNAKRGSQIQGYTTGDASVSSGAKTSSFAGNYTSAEGRFFDPRVTNDLHNWRLFNVSADEIPSLRKNQRTGEMEWFIDRPHEQNVANNDRAYRGVESVIGELAREYGVDGYSMQSGLWDGMRSIQRDPEVLRLWQQGHFRDAVELGKRRNLFGEVNPDMEFAGDVRSVMDSMPVKRAIAQYGEYLKDPLPRELGITTIERSFKGKRLGRSSKTSPAAKPSNLAFREEQRPYAEANAPLVQGLDEATARRLGYDRERGIFPWLEASHRVVQVAPDEFAVHLPAGNEDTARYVAAQVGQASNAERVQIHVPDYRAGEVIGVGARGTPDQVAALQRALDNMGITSIVGTGRRSLQVPLERVGDTRTLDAVQDAALSIGFPEEQVGTYNGRHSDVPRAEYAATSEQLAPTFAPTSAERSDLLQRGLGAVPAERGPPGIARARQRGEASLPFSANVAGAAFGGYAGNVATPEGASPEERLRNIAAGAATGFAAGHLITRPPRLQAATAGAERAGGPREPFRAPGRPEGPELRASTLEPPGGPVGPTGRPPRTLGEVRSNRYALREAGPGETPMTPDEMLDYGDELEQRLEAVQARRDAVDEMLRNPSAKVDRPPWAAGYTNDQLATIARQHDISAYEPNWWEKVGLEAGSGEVRENVGQGTVARGGGQRELTPAELRAERKRLDAEMGDIQTAYDQMASAPAEPNLVRAVSDREAATAAELPFDTGAPPEPEPATAREAGGGLDEGARTAQEIVLSKGRGTLRSDAGTVSLEGDVRATSLVSHEAVQAATETPPSARTEANMPNLDSMLEGEPEIAAQIRKAAEDNPDLFEAYRQGTISQDSLKNDLAKRVGMTVQDWIKTPIGKGFNERELVALQAAAIEQQGRMQDLGRDILAKGGVDSLTPEELVFSMATLADATKILAVARGGRTTAGRTLNALKNKFDRTMAQGITAANERIAANRLAQQARRAATRATTVLAKGRELEREASVAKAEASRNGAPRNVLRDIDQAYAELDRYNAMTLHEKGAEFDRLKAERAKRAAARKERVRGAPEELLSALRSELKAEQDNFAKRKETWEDLAFWDTKAFENAMDKRTAFRGQLYIEQQRKVANIAAKDAEKEAARAFDAELQRKTNQQAKAQKLLESIGGQEVTREVLRNFVQAMDDPAPDAAAKFLKGMAKPSNWARATTLRVAGLLSGPLTHMANMSGNVARAVVEVPVRATTVGIDAMRAAVTGGERQAYRAELLPMLQAWAPGMYANLPEALRALKTGVRPEEIADLSKVRAGFGSGNAAVDAAVEMPLRLLTAEDILFRGAAYSAHAQRVTMREAIKEGFTGNAAKGRAATILKNLEEYPDLGKEIEDAARHMVFQERRNVPLPRMMPGGKPVAGDVGRFAVSQVAPFIQTPANITAQGAGMSPLGFGGALEAARGVREMPTGTRAERYARGRQVLLAEERAARAVVGTGILGAGLALGSAGMLTGAYSEDPKVNTTYPQGWRPWSLRIGDPVTDNTYYIPLQNFAVAGVPLAIAAILTDPTHHGKTVMDPEEFGMAVTGLGKYVLDNTFLQGMSDFVDALQDPGRRGGQFFESLAGSYGPYSAMGREIQRSMGTATRNPREGIRGLIDAMEANYPGLSGDVPPALTPLGEERTQGATGAGRLVPFRYDIERDEPTLQVLRSSGVAVPTVPKAVGLKGGSVELTEAERAQLQQLRGQAIRDAVAGVNRDPRNVQRAVQLATQNANARFLDSLGTAEINRRWQAKAAPEPYYLGTAAGA
jgi:cell wall-associated NlpC family hydrolase